MAQKAQRRRLVTRLIAAKVKKEGGAYMLALIGAIIVAAGEIILAVKG